MLEEQVHDDLVMAAFQGELQEALALGRLEVGAASVLGDKLPDEV